MFALHCGEAHALLRRERQSRARGVSMACLESQGLVDVKWACCSRAGEAGKGSGGKGALNSLNSLKLTLWVKGLMGPDEGGPWVLALLSFRENPPGIAPESVKHGTHTPAWPPSRLAL